MSAGTKKDVVTCLDSPRETPGTRWRRQDPPASTVVGIPRDVSSSRVQLDEAEASPSDEEAVYVGADETPLSRTAASVKPLEDDHHVDPENLEDEGSFLKDCVIVGSNALDNWGLAHRFGFPHSTVDYVARAENDCHNFLRQEIAQCEEKWTAALKGVPLLASAVPSSCEPLRRLARRYGIPVDLRGIMWLTLSGVAIKVEENPHFCVTLLQRSGYATGEADDAIRKDLERTFPEHPYFMPGKDGVVRLKHVLHALCWRNPLLNYCQSFNFLAAMLLLFLDDEESVFWMMCHMLEDLLPNDFYGEGLMGLKVDQEVANELIETHVPRVAEHFAWVHFDLRALVPQWVMSFFINVLPIETTVRVWDYLITQDAKGLPTVVHLEIVVAILKLVQDELLRTNDCGEVLDCLTHFTQTLFDGGKLVQTAHDLKLHPAVLFEMRRKHRSRLQARLLQERAVREHFHYHRPKRAPPTYVEKDLEAPARQSQTAPSKQAVDGGTGAGDSASARRRGDSAVPSGEHAPETGVGIEMSEYVEDATPKPQKTAGSTTSQPPAQSPPPTAVAPSVAPLQLTKGASHQSVEESSDSARSHSSDVESPKT